LDWNEQKPHLYILIFEASCLVFEGVLLPLLPPAIVEGSLTVKPLGTLF